MEVDKLSSFVEVYNCRSVSRAADNLYISQSALSRRIQALEEELHVKLFQRVGSDFLPTPAGDALFKDAVKIIREHEKTILKMNQFRTGHGGSLRIACSPTMKHRPLLQAISRMQQQEPEVQLLFNCDYGLNMLQMFIENKIDLTVATYGEIRGLSTLHYDVLGQNTWSVLIGRNHPLWKKRPIYAADLNGTALCRLSSEAVLSQEALMLWCRQNGIIFSEVIPCRSLQEQLMVVATGTAVTLSGIHVAELYSAYPDLMENVPVSGTELDIGYPVVIYSPDNPLSRQFAELLKEFW